MPAGTSTSSSDMRVARWLVSLRGLIAVLVVVNGLTWWGDGWDVPGIGPVAASLCAAGVLLATSAVDWYGLRHRPDSTRLEIAGMVGDAVLALLIVVVFDRQASDAVPIAVLLVCASFAVRSTATVAVSACTAVVGTLMASRLLLWPSWSTDWLDPSFMERVTYGPVLLPLILPVFVRVLHAVADDRDAARALAEERAQRLDTALLDLRQANADLEASNAELGQYAQRISHDLQAPLSTVIGGIETIRAHGERLSDEDHARLLDRGLQAAWSASRAVSAMLDQAVHGDTGRRRAMDLGALVDDVLDVTSAAVAVEVDAGGHHAMADPDLLRIVFQNLLLNAIKHGGSTVRVSASPSQDMIAVVVEDDGPGIPEAERESVFAPGVRGGAVQRGGHGLGLATVRTIIERHGGTVEVRDSSLGGAAIWFTLPPADQPDPDGTRATSSSSGSSSPTPDAS